MAACSSDEAPPAAADGGQRVHEPPGDDAQPSSHLPPLCLREGDDAVRDLFCGASAPVIRGFRDFDALLQAVPVVPDGGSEAQSGNGFGIQTVAALGHSTALSGQLVSPINPRLIFVRDNSIITFQRGVQRVELITLDRKGEDDLNFYLLEFEQACNEQEGGCSPGDLYTPKIESDWTRVTIRDDEDLKNTAFDCRQCHQRGRDKPSLLMRELQSPWTHFFYPVGADAGLPGATGSDLLQDYLDAKGEELYGGYYLGDISPTSPFFLEATVGDDQPLLFDAPKIDTERWPYSEEQGYASEAQPSPTWERGYEAFKRGEQLALPYLDSRAVDVDKQLALSDAYRRYRAGELDARELPDLADIFPDDPVVRARIGLETEPGASAEDVLIQACGSCHNDVLDQTISRARFSVSVSRLDRGTLDRAIERLTRARTDHGVMPPAESRQLTHEARAKLIEYLRGTPPTLDSTGRLEHAARMGMTGGALRDVL